MMDPFETWAGIILTIVALVLALSPTQSKRRRRRKF